MKRMVIACLALIGCFVALYLAMFKLGYIGTMSCSIGGCERVNTSKWAMLLGVPVAVWGLGFYVATFAVAVIGTLPRWENDILISHLLLGMTGFGVVFSGWLTYLELFVIYAICQYCVVSALLVVAIFIFSVFDWREKRQQSY